MSNKKLCFQWGSQSSTSDWTSTPSLTHATPTNNPLFAPDLNYVNRADYQQCDGDAIPNVQSGKNVSVPDLSFEIAGLSGSGAGDATAASGLSHGLEPAFTLLSSSLVSGTGDTTDASDAGSGTTLTTDGGSPWALGEIVLVEGTTSGKLCARVIEAKSGSNNTINAALTDDTGSADTPAESSVVYAGKNYYFDGTTPDRTHFYIDAEGDGWRYTYDACFGSGSLAFPTGGLASLNLSNLMCTDWATASPAAPGYTAPTAGSPIPVVDSPCWINGSLYMAYDIELDLGVGFNPRRSDGAPNGHWGGVADVVRPMLNFKLRAGTLSLETTEAVMESFRADGTEEVMIQIGRTPGAAMAIYAPALKMQMLPVSDGILRAYQVTGQCTYYGSAPTSNPTSPLTVTIF